MDDLAAFLDRRDPETIENSAERFEDRAGGWLDVMAAATDLHPITRACMGSSLSTYWIEATGFQPVRFSESVVIFLSGI